jgi:hypothetical protein
MKITEDVRKYAAEQGIAEEEALKKGMEEKSREFVLKGAELLCQDLRPEDSSGARKTFAERKPLGDGGIHFTRGCSLAWHSCQHDNLPPIHV